MAKTRKAATTREDVMSVAKTTLEKDLNYESVEDVLLEGETCGIARRRGRPVVLVFVPQGHGPITAATQELAIQLGAIVEGGPADYVWATTSGRLNDGFIYSWLPHQECEVSSIPPASKLGRNGSAGTRVRPAADPVRFKQLQHEFDQLHEQVYASREPIDGSNDLTAQLCKCIFLKMHLERRPDFRPIAGGPLFEEIFRADYIKKNGERAVEQIKKAFEVARSLPEYCVKDDQGRDFRIFDQDDFIKFQKPETYASIAEMLRGHQLTTPEETGVEDDIIGRAFDVMLRAKFESKGGMGIYLTPQQVRDAMVQMVFHDILHEDSGLVTRRDAKSGMTQFRVCDPCCGSAGFLITAMREVRKQIDKLLGLSASQRHDLLSEVFSQGFEGADSSPNMVLMGRINMALHGDPKARVFRVANSLTTDIFTPESFDVILTNPPFKKGGITEKDQGGLLESFRSDISNGAPAMKGSGLALGSKPDSKGVWKPVNSIDPAILFIDRCMQLLKPGGRLLIVVPDGVLCNSQDRYVREYLMGKKEDRTGKFIGGKALVRAVVSLPAVTFRLSGAGAKTSFLYLQKKRPGDEQGPVFMAVSNNVGFDVKANKEVLTGENDLIKIVEAYKAGPTVGTQESAT